MVVGGSRLSLLPRARSLANHHQSALSHVLSGVFFFRCRPDRAIALPVALYEHRKYRCCIISLASTSELARPRYLSTTHRQRRWDAASSRRPSAPTSRSASTTRAPSSDPRGTSSPTLRLSSLPQLHLPVCLFARPVLRRRSARTSFIPVHLYELSPWSSTERRPLLTRSMRMHVLLIPVGACASALTPAAQMECTHPGSSCNRSFAVKHQLKLHNDSLRPGDVLVTNSPSAGGSSVASLPYPLATSPF